MFKNSILTIVTLLALLIFPKALLAEEVSTSEESTITLGYVDFPPYEFEEEGKPSGILVAIVEKLFEKANIPLKLELYPFKRAFNSTKEGQIDGLFNFYKTEERLKSFDYTTPIIENPLVLFVRKDSNIEYSKLEDLKGLSVGTMHGYSYGTEFDESTLFYKDSANSHVANFKKLTLGRIDVYPCDKLVGLHVAMENNFLSELKMLPIPLKVMEGHIGFTKGKHQAIIDKLNIVIEEMHDSREIKEMIDQYIVEEM